MSPQGTPKIEEKTMKSDKKTVPKRGLPPEGSPRGPRGALESILDRFSMILGSELELKLVENRGKKVAGKRVSELGF